MKKFKIALQLYSIREFMAENMDETLKAVKEMGYDYVEFAGYYDKEAEEIKALLDKHGLECVSAHRGPDFFINDEEKEIHYLKTLGAKYCAIPWYAVDEFVNNWDETIKKFKKVYEIMAKNDIKLLYHNHEFEFTKVGDEYIIDKLYKEMPEICPQFDTCWVRYADENPADYIRKYKDKVEVVHLKDFSADKLAGGPVYELIGQKSSQEQRDDNGFRFRALGQGRQDWNEILKACEDVDADILVVEQDRWYEESALSEVKKSREFLKEKFGI